MAGRGFCVKIDLDVHAITCPGVWLCPNGKVALQLNAFGNRTESRRLTPIFPLLFHDKFTFKKVFTGVATLTELQRSLEEEFLYTELVQWSSPESRGVILATFETNLVDLLYPAPCFKGLLAGVDIDLLMEPTKYFPGIIAPKIEISTRTVIKEVVGICDSSTSNAHVVNPKVINSKSPSCFRRKPPSKGIIRQRKVCHAQGRHRSQACRNCNERQIDLEGERIYTPSLYNQRSLSPSEECYHDANKPNCPCSCTSPQKNIKHTSVCDDSHVFESCPVCSRYKCYFGCHCEGREDVCACRCGGHASKIHGKTHTEHRSPKKQGSSCSCRPTSAPSPRVDPSTLLLKTKMRQLQKAKARLSHISNGREDDSSTYDHCCHQKHHGATGRQGFYKNLEKFYKRMYKQARLRAQEADGV